MEITAETATVAAEIGAAPAALTRGLVAGLRAVGLKYDGVAKRMVTGEALDRRSGMSGRAIFHTITTATIPQGASVTLTMGANLALAPGLRLHERGGVVRPKRGPYLTIPLDAAKTASGVARFSARDVIANPTAHGFSDTFWKASKGQGTPVLYGAKYRRGTVEGQRVLLEGGRIVPLFLLTKEAHIPATRWLTRAVDRLEDDLAKATADAALVSKGGG